MSQVYQTNTTQFGLFDSHGFVFGANNGGPCLPGWTLFGSSVWLLQVILADAPFVAIGLLGFALGTFFVIGGKIQRSIFYITAAILLAFFAAVFDLSQTLIGNTTNRTLSGLIVAQQFFLTWSTLGRFLFFYRFVFEPPPGEVPVASTGSGARAAARGATMHSASWERHGVVGMMSKWLLLLSIINIAILEGIWRVGFLFVIPKFRPLYTADQILQIIVSAFIFLKLALNVREAARLGRSKWEMVGIYTAPVLGLAIGAAIAGGGLSIFLFSEMYILAVFVLVIYHRYHRPESASFRSLSDRSNTTSPLDASGAEKRVGNRPSFIGLGVTPRLSTFRLSPPNVSSPNSAEIHEAAQNLQRQSYLDGRILLNESRLSRASKRASEAFTSWSNYMRSNTPGGGDRTPAPRSIKERNGERLWEKGRAMGRTGSPEGQYPPSAGPTTAGFETGTRGSAWLENRDTEAAMGTVMDQDEDDLRTAKPIASSLVLPPLPRGPSPFSRNPSPFLTPSSPPRAAVGPPQRPVRPASILPFEVRAPGAPLTPDSSRPRSFCSIIDGAEQARPSSQLVPTLASLAAQSQSQLGSDRSRSDRSYTPEDSKSYVTRPGSAFNRQSNRSTAQSSGTSEFSMDAYTTDFPVPPKRADSYAPGPQQQYGVAIGGDETVAESEASVFDLLPPRMPAVRAEQAMASRSLSVGSSTGGESRTAMDAEFDVTSFIAGARDTIDAHPGTYAPPIGRHDSPSESLFSMPASPQAQIMQAELVTRRPSQSRRASRIASSAIASSYYASSAATVTPEALVPPFPLPPPASTTKIGLPANPRSATPSTAPSSPVETDEVVTTEESSVPNSAGTIRDGGGNAKGPPMSFALPTTTSLYRNPARPIRHGETDKVEISNPMRAPSAGVAGGVFERPRPAPIATGMRRK